ncbi:MAG: hypothetical protein GF331_15190 [Chitinivibrionales bacterium]|nr:hypothetical protein [Chitinivibrionales bacterium]
MRLLHAVKDDSVFLFLSENPRLGHSFVVERKGPADDTFVRLTETPIGPVMSPERVEAMLGSDLRTVIRGLEVSSANELLVRLRTDRFAAAVHTMLYHSVGRVLGRFFVAGGHEEDETYAFRVILMDESGEGYDTLTEKITVRERPPAPPTKLAAAQEGRSIRLSWQYPEWDGGADDMAVRFFVYRKGRRGRAQRINARVVLRLKGVELAYDDEAVIEGETYTYSVAAVDAAGVVGKRSEPVKVTVEDRTAPETPLGISTRVDGSTVEVVWRMSPELDVAGYLVYRWADGAEDSVVLNEELLAAADAQYRDSDIALGHQYYYAVSAIDHAGNESERTARISAFPTDATPPSAPKAPRAEYAEEKVTLSWSPSADEDIAGYRLLRGPSEEHTVSLNAELLADTQFVDTGGANGFVPGRRYYYAVVAVDSVALQSKPIGTWVAVPDAQPPQRPGAVRAENDYGRGVRVRWNASVSHDVARYRVTRLTASARVALDTLDNRTLELYDTAAAVGEHSYEVVAIDHAGNLSDPTVSDAVSVRDYEGPPRPRFVAATRLADGNRVYWERVVDFDLNGYNVYRSSMPTGRFERVNEAPVASLELVDKSGEPSAWYRVRAVDATGNEGRASRAVAVQGGEE